MRFGHIEIFVADPLASMAFYRDVLLCKVEAIQHEQFVWLQLDGLTILLRPGHPLAAAGAYREAQAGLVLYTDNLERTKNELEQRGLQFKGTDGSEKCLVFCDPDGNWFQLVNPAEH